MPSPDGFSPGDNHYESDIEFDGTGCLGDCCQSKGIWGSFDYLLWWTKGQRTPPLVTTSDPADSGVLGEPTTEIIYGNESISAGNRSGGRFEIGKWMDACNELGVGGRFFGLGDDSTRFFRASDGDPLLARPFFNADLGAEDSLVIASPGIASDGAISVETTSQIYGAEAFIRKMVHRDCRARTDMIIGYQFSRINEGLKINSVFTSIDPNGEVPVGTVIDVEDQFTTENSFHGAEIGFTSQYHHCRWSAQFLGKLGVGMMRQTVNVKGDSAVTVPNDPTDFRPFGLLAQPSNIGSRSQDEFVVVPELGINLTYCVTNHFQLMVGYTFMYWSSVVQPGNQIDRVISPADDNGQQDLDVPQPKFHESDYWAQGVNFGAQWTW